MKFAITTTALAAFLMASAPALAQFISIGYPPEGMTVPANSQVTVEIDRPNFQSSGREVALVLGLNSFCVGPGSGTGPSGCAPPAGFMGDIQYDGAFTPQSVQSLPWKPPHQNFTITVGGPGVVQINAFHVGLVGAGNGPFTDFANITLNVQ